MLNCLSVMLKGSISKPLKIKTKLIYINSGVFVTDLITTIVQLLQRDINGLVKTALGELKLVKL